MALLTYRNPTKVDPIPPDLQVTNPDQHIVIIGAGAAGLFTAYTLEYIGYHNYTILEASSKFGGRAQRIDDFVDVPLDLGPEWIHANPQILKDLLLFENNVGDEVETIPFQPKTYSFHTRGRLRRRDWARFFYKEYKFKNTTWSQYLENYVVPHVQEHIVYNSAVQQIDYGGDLTTITTVDGTNYSAGRVVVATPPNILRDGDIKFVPDLSVVKKTAYNEIDWDDGFKVIIEFRERFYTDMTMDIALREFFLSSEHSDRIFFDAVFGKDQTSRNVMTLYSVGPAASEWAGQSDEELIQTVLAKLDDLYDGQASENYVQHVVQNWVKEPYVRGAFVYDADQTVLRESIDDKIYFAGDYIAPGYEMSTIHGASMSGRATAVSIASK